MRSERFTQQKFMLFKSTDMTYCSSEIGITFGPQASGLTISHRHHVDNVIQYSRSRVVSRFLRRRWSGAPFLTHRAYITSLFLFIYCSHHGGFYRMAVVRGGSRISGEHRVETVLHISREG